MEEENVVAGVAVVVGVDEKSSSTNTPSLNEMISIHQIITHQLNSIEDKDLITNNLMNESREHNLLIGKHNKLTNEVLFLLKNRHQKKLLPPNSGEINFLKYPPQRRSLIPHHSPSSPLSCQIHIPISIILDINKFRLRESFIISLKKDIPNSQDKEEEEELFLQISQSICQDFDIPTTLFIEPLISGMRNDVLEYRKYYSSSLSFDGKIFFVWISLDITCGFVRIQDHFKWKLFPIEDDEMKNICNFSISLVEDNNLSLEFATAIQHQICEYLYKERRNFCPLSPTPKSPFEEKNTLKISELDPLVMDQMESGSLDGGGGGICTSTNIRTPISYKGSLHNSHGNEVNDVYDNGSSIETKLQTMNTATTTTTNRKRNRNRK